MDRAALDAARNWLRDGERAGKPRGPLKEACRDVD